MAKKKLNSIVWPNIPNDVYYLDADKVEYDDTETYSEGSVGDALQNKANIDGSYENLTAGNAEQLTTDIRANDQTPYLFRTAGGSVDIGDREYINGIVGGTVAFNQLVATLRNSASLNGLTITADATDMTVRFAGTSTQKETYTCGTVTSGVVPANHVVIGFAGVNKTASYSPNVGAYTPPLGADGVIIKSSGSALAVNLIVENGATIDITIRPMLIDLTQMFGSTIADYIYSLEQANAGAGVAFFKSLFPKPYYAYNAGELMSVKGLVSHDMVGFNAWDEEWESGAINGADGSAYADASKIRSKNFIPVVGGTTYYVKAPSVFNYAWYDADKSYISGDNSATANYTRTAPVNAKYLKFSIGGTTYNHDICINLSWDGSRNGEYEPYQKWSYPLDSDLELRGIPKLDNGNLYYDGDVYGADGTVTRKYGIVDLGTLTWSYSSSGVGRFQSSSISVASVANDKLANIICTNYPTASAADVYSYVGFIGVNNTGLLWVSDTSKYSNDPTAFTTAMSGVYLVYELATPTTETADPYTSPQIVNDFGTEEFVISNTVAVPIPVGHNTDYPINLKAKVEMMPNSPDGDGDYIVRQTNGTNEYVSIANNSTISGLVSRSPVASGADGTYVLKATISGGTVTYSWEAE